VSPRTPLPDVVRARAELLGEPGRAWVAGLDTLVDDLAGRWQLTVLGPLSGGTAAVVLRCRDSDGRDAVLKLAVPDPELAHQVDTLVRAGGRGYARVLAAAEDRFAVLLEALGPSLDRSGLSPEDQMGVLSETLAEAWAVPPAAGQRTTDKAGQLHDLVSRLWRDLDEPCRRSVRDRALGCAERRSADPPARWVLVHGDAAAPNCLRVPDPRPGAGSGYVFVDPDGFVGDPAYDLGVALRDWSPQLLAAGNPTATMRRWCRLVAGLSGLDSTAIEDWALLERVSTGLFALSLGMADVGRQMLRSAEAL
jgi:streptomycin 6-kinase